jgi:post-segregation antitoxin (ccd killing protein)
MVRSYNRKLSAEDKQRKKKLSLNRDNDAWLTENQIAIEQYNKRTYRKGAFSDAIRRF